MEFKQSVILCVRDKYADFNGRAGQSEFWWFMLACVAVNTGFNLLNLHLLGTLASLALAVPGLAAGARRLHDIGKSGWLQLLWLVPILGWAVVVYWLAQPSAGPNQYGAGPGAPAEASPSA